MRVLRAGRPAPGGSRPAYTTVDVLCDPAIRDGIKEFSEWPTIPQLYVKGTFVGGCDIVRDLHAPGELAKLLGAADAAATPRRSRVTPAAAKAFADALSEAGGDVLRFSVSPRFEYDLFLGPKADGDSRSTGRAPPLRGSRERPPRERDDDRFRRDAAGRGLQDRESERAREGEADRAGGARQDAQGRPIHLYDVRTPRERDIAKIEGAQLVDSDAQDHIAKLPRTRRSCSTATTAVGANPQRSTSSAKVSRTSTTCRAGSTPGRCAWIPRSRAIDGFVARAK